MSGIGQQVGFLFISWAFLFIVLYLFALVFGRRIGKNMGTRERIFLVGEISLMCAAANIAVGVAVKPHHM